MEEENKTVCTYLEEAPGEKSMMRLMSITSLWMSFFYGIVAIIIACFSLTLAAQCGLTLAGMHLIGAFVPKAFQRMVENENFFLFKK